MNCMNPKTAAIAPARKNCISRDAFPSMNAGELGSVKMMGMMGNIIPNPIVSMRRVAKRTTRTLRVRFRSWTSGMAHSYRRASMGSCRAAFRAG